MQVFYTPRYYAEIGQGHVFPIRKFELVRNRLLEEGTLDPSEIVEPSPAPLEDVLLVHTQDYVTRLCNGQLTTKKYDGWDCHGPSHSMRLEPRNCLQPRNRLF